MTTAIPFADFDRIYPTENDISFATYNGVNSSEVNFSKNLHWRKPHNCILANLDGGGLPTDNAGFKLFKPLSGLELDVTRGRAYISGRYIELLTGANYSVTVDADRDVYIFLQLSISGVVNTSPPANLVTVPVTHGSKPTIPPDSVLLGLAVTDATDVTSVQDYRPSQNSYPIRFEIDSIVDALLVPTKRRIYAPPEDIYLCGFFNVFNSLNNNSITVSYDLKVIGPNGTIVNVFTGAVVPINDSLQDFRAVKLDADLGRFLGGYLEIELTNVSVSAGAGTAQVSTTVNNQTHIQDIASSWALKEWKAMG